jgi:hypothetical protein
MICLSPGLHVSCGHSSAENPLRLYKRATGRTQHNGHPIPVRPRQSNAATPFHVVNSKNWSFEMKFNARRAVWTLALTLTLIAFGSPKFAAAYQSQEGAEHGRGQNGWEHDRDGHDRGPAFQNGFQDGRNDGQQDRQTRHSSRPTHDRNYKNATHGYNYQLGNRNQYKAAYREAYMQGYAEGFNGRDHEHDRDHDGDSDHRR